MSDTTSLWHDLIEAERELRRAAEKLASGWREAFLSLAAMMVPDLDKLALPSTPEGALEAVSRRLSARSRWPSGEATERLREEIERLKGENARLLAEVERLRQAGMEMERLRWEVERLRRENAHLSAERERPQPPIEEHGDEASPTPSEARLSGETHPAPPLEVSDLAEIIKSVRRPPPQFQAEFFAKDGLLIAIIGKTGISSRPRIAKTLGAALGISPRSGSLTRCFERCERLDLIHIHKAPGAPFSLLSLTLKGKEAYRQIFRVDPIPSEVELLLEAHPGNLIHAVYCVWAREFAEVAGYIVEYPGRPPIPGPSSDLIFRYGNEVLGVEVERALAGNDPRKWEAIAERWGIIAVIAPDRETAERLETYLQGKSYWITDFTYLVETQPKTPDSFWRKRRCGA